MLLVTLAKYKEALRITGTGEDARLTEAIEDASAAVLRYTDRDFGAAAVTEARTYKYNGAGFLEIDDASNVTQVKLGTLTLAASTWTAMPHRATAEANNPNAYYWLELPERRQRSAEMGFERNEDVYLQQHSARQYLDAEVTATWGWPTIPDDVQRATIWTAQFFDQQTAAAGGIVTSESVAEVSRSYQQAFEAQQAREQTPELAIPPRAQALLDPFAREVLPG